MKTLENSATSLINYSLNKFLPFIFIGVILFLKMGFETFEPYLVLGLVLFVERFSYKVGYAVAVCEERGLINKDD